MMDSTELSAILSVLGAILVALISLIGIFLKNRLDSARDAKRMQVETRLIREQFKNNGGSTLRDKVDKVFERIDEIDTASRERDKSIKETMISMNLHTMRTVNWIQDRLDRE